MSAPSAPYVVSVIVSSNRPPELAACLESLARSTYAHHTALVVTYNAQPELAAVIHSADPQAQTIAVPDNRGYAGNNNFGIQWSLEHQADWVFILNDDTVLAPDCLERLVA